MICSKTKADVGPGHVQASGTNSSGPSQHSKTVYIPLPRLALYRLPFFRMLYDFHKTQNARRPGAVHATYLVHGVKRAAEHLNGGDGDVEMKNSSADTDSIAEDIPIFTIALVPEDQLKGAQRLHHSL